MSDQSSISFENAPRRWDVILTFVLTSLVALVGVPWYGVVHGFSATAVIATVILFAFNNLSITTGYHRLWSHKAYKANPILRVILALGGAFALQNSVLKWSSDHRRHHGNVDDNDKDPYSANRGFWFSHIGWMLRDYPSAPKDFSNVRDLEKDPIVSLQHRFYLPLALLMNIGLPVLIGWVIGDVWGMLLLGGFLRLVVGHHTTFFINSLAHILGSQPYSTRHTAKDNPIMAVLTFGEGYHNYHHTFPGDYRNAIRWWQWDPTKWVIKGCSLVGLATDLRTVPIERVLQERQAGVVDNAA